MKKLLTQTLVLAIALGITITTFAQSPNNGTRQRRTAADGTQQDADNTVAAADKTTDANAGKSKDNKTAEVTADGKTNRVDDSSEEAAIVPYYNNFFMNYRLGPEDVISVNVFNQDRYSKQGVKIPPSGRIYLALIPEGIFVNGKTPDQVAELVKKRYDEFIIDPQVTVSLDKAASYRYSVIGDVLQPGIRLMNHRMTVTEALAEAGGVLGTGDKSRVVVLRRQADGMLATIPVNVSAIYKGRTADTTYLVPGDQIIVPGNKLKKIQTLLGFANVLSFARVFGVPVP